MRAGRARSHGADIYYERHGTGPAILFCHGAGSNSATWWQQVPAFAQQFTCIVYDHRGFGRSHAPDEPFDPNVLVDDALAVLDAEGIDRAALVCQSLGGITGLRLALAHPERVWAFVPCDSPLGIDHDQMQVSVARYAMSGITRLEERALARSFRERQPELVWLYGQIHRFNPSDNTLRERVLGLLAPRHLVATQRLASLRCPTLFVVGAEDPLVTPAIVRDIAHWVPESTVAEIEGAGHSPYFEKPKEFNALVSSFLSSCVERVA